MRSLTHAKTRLISLTCLSLALATTQIRAQEPAAKPSAQTPDPARAKAEADARTAVEVIARAIKTVNGYTSIEAQVKETVVMGTRRLTATGRLVQGTDNQLRLEMAVGDIEQLAKAGEAVKLDPAARAAAEKKKAEAAAKATPEDTGDKTPAANAKKNAVIHVCDGSVLWTQWTTNGKSRVDRRNIQEILKEFDSSKVSPDQLMAGLGIGGIPSLLKSMQDRMVFNSTAEKQIDGKPFVVVQGRWSDEQARRMVTQRGQLPSYVPEFVRVFFEKKTMFPRRIVFLKKHPAPTVMTAKPMVTLDFTNVVLNGDVDAAQFRFAVPATMAQDDLTEQIIKRLKQHETTVQQQQPRGPVANPGGAGQ